MGKKYAKDIDKERTAQLEKKEKAKKRNTEKRKIKRTTIQTLPYEKFINKTTLLLQSNVRIGKQTANLYSKTYMITDANYSSLTENEQMEKLKTYIQLLNGFDSTVSLQLSIINQKVDKGTVKKVTFFRDAHIIKADTKKKCVKYSFEISKKCVKSTCIYLKKVL